MVLALLFTLNQDLLFERRYRGRLVTPGVETVEFETPDEELPDDKLGRATKVDSRCEVAKNELNYIKIHGSFNWRSADGGRLLVAGGNKIPST